MMKYYLYVVLFVASLSMNVVIASESSLVDIVKIYTDKVSLTEKENKKVSIKRLINEGDSIARKLRKVIESLPELEFDEIRNNMKGFIIVREEVVIVEIDPVFFQILAEKVGIDEDRIYFNYLGRFYKYGTWPIYIEQQTDLGGCIKFGEQHLTNLHKAANLVNSKLSGIYKRDIKNKLQELERTLSRSNCVCKDKESVISEYEYFLSQNDKSSFSSVIQSRLELVKSSKSPMRYNCVGGI